MQFTISEMAEATNLSTHTLRDDERAGRMRSPVERASSSHRRYTENDVAWVVFLTRLRSTSMPIARIREYVELVRLGESTTAERLELLLRHRITVLAQLDELNASLTAIDYKITTYQEIVPS